MFLGYKNNFSSIMRACAAIAVGIVMVVSVQSTIMVVRIIAACLCAAGIVSLIYSYANKQSGAVPLLSFNAVVDIILGLILFFFPVAVAGFIVKVIGVVLVVLGALQLLVVMKAMSLLGMGWLSLVFSVVALLGGILLIFNPFTEFVMSKLAGGLLIFYGVSELLSMKKVGEARKVFDIKFTVERDKDDESEGKTDFSGISDAKEVEYHKVED